MTYADKLKDPRWQRKRLAIMDRDGWQCCKCRDASSTLNVHHVNYRKGAAPWDYDADNFVTLCEKCHKNVEDKIRAARVEIIKQFKGAAEPAKRAKKVARKAHTVEEPASPESLRPCTREEAQAHFAALKIKLKIK